VTYGSDSDGGISESDGEEDEEGLTEEEIKAKEDKRLRIRG
jgi:hypothetical protein